MPRPKKSDVPPPESSPASFEDALARLEAIVEMMENENLPLNDLIDQYENGTRLFQACDRLLGQARERLELITLKSRQDPSTTPATEIGGDGDSDDEELRLH